LSWVGLLRGDREIRQVSNIRRPDAGVAGGGEDDALLPATFRAPRMKSPNEGEEAIADAAAIVVIAGELGRQQSLLVEDTHDKQR
jgi:hypothetical protein